MHSCMLLERRSFAKYLICVSVNTKFFDVHTSNRSFTIDFNLGTICSGSLTNTITAIDVAKIELN